MLGDESSLTVAKFLEKCECEFDKGESDTLKQYMQLYVKPRQPFGNKNNNRR
jgi:hypothetical protein